MSWKIRHEGSPQSIDNLTLEQVVEGLQDGHWEATDEVMGPQDTEWVAVRPELVCEVTYDKLEAGERFRHATGFLRWRTDKPPKKCGFDQIASAASFDVRGIFGSK